MNTINSLQAVSPTVAIVTFDEHPGVYVNLDTALGAGAGTAVADIDLVGDTLSWGDRVVNADALIATGVPCSPEPDGHATWVNYAARAGATAWYPGRGENIVYAALGLAGEISELAVALGEGHMSNIIAESGDVYWYLAAVCYEANIHPGIFDLIEAAPVDRSQVPAAATSGPATWVRDTVTYMGAIAEAAKKTVRDDASVVTDARRERIITSMTALTRVLAEIAEYCGTKPAGIRQRNLDKLADRRGRDVLAGDGDNR